MFLSFFRVFRVFRGLKWFEMNIKTLLPDLKKLVVELDEDLLVRAQQDDKIDAGLREAFKQIEKGGAPPRRSRFGERTISIRSPWRGCWPASSCASWRTTT